MEPRNDLAPFNDIRVREALQMALNLPEIANSFYQGTAQPYPQSLTSSYQVGWAWPYQQWPADLQAQYAYNPTAAKQLLAQAGFPNGFNTDVVADNSGNMDLLQIVQSYFAAIGVNMTIQAMDPASWTSYVVVGKKQDALAYRSGAGTLGNINTPIKMLQRDMNGFAGNFSHVNDPVFNAFYPAAMAANYYRPGKANRNASQSTCCRAAFRNLDCSTEYFWIHPTVVQRLYGTIRCRGGRR